VVQTGRVEAGRRTVVYTDGACHGNPGPGGWAWATSPDHYAAGAEAETTNQRMELTAVIEAVANHPGPLEIVSDSTYVVRCFEDPDIVHVTGSVDPVRDIEIVTTELVLADIETVKKRREKISKDVKRGDKHALLEEHLLEQIGAHLNTGKPANTLALPLAPDEKIVMRSFFLLTDKPTVFACNIKEGDLATADKNPFVQKVRDYVKTHLACEAVVVSAQIESDLIDLSPDEAKEFLKELGVAESGLGQLIRAAYQVLGLRTFFTFNEKEVRAWTIHAGDTAVKAAGTIHTDFERGFIKAETVNWDDLVKCGSVGHARETGHYRIEGRDYAVKDGDVLLFKFNV